eukprot:2728992-Prymnesium_polylepis.1
MLRGCCSGRWQWCVSGAAAGRWQWQCVRVCGAMSTPGPCAGWAVAVAVRVRCGGHTWPVCSDSRRRMGLGPISRKPRTCSSSPATITGRGPKRSRCARIPMTGHVTVYCGRTVRAAARCAVGACAGERRASHGRHPAARHRS